MKESEIAREIIRLYNSYYNAIIADSKRTGVEYTDQDFNSLENFIKYLSNNINNL